jgi:hypothetical protein
MEIKMINQIKKCGYLLITQFIPSTNCSKYRKKLYFLPLILLKITTRVKTNYSMKYL